jgi:hypothetical protein
MIVPYWAASPKGMIGFDEIDSVHICQETGHEVGNPSCD